MIAFTSQLAHVVSSAYVKTPLAPKHKGFSAGSFRDMTRVARLIVDRRGCVLLCLFTGSDEERKEESKYSYGRLCPQK